MSTEVWNRALDFMRQIVPGNEFSVWLEPVQFVSFDPASGVVRLSVASDFYLRWIERTYMTQLKAALHEAAGAEVRVDITVAPDGEAPSRSAETGAPARPMLREDPRGPSRYPSAPAAPETRLPWNSRLNPRYTFRDFVVGESNRYAHAAAQSMLLPDSEGFNPVFFWGQSGLGKTHLMHAIGHVLHERRPDARIAYVMSEQFINSFIESLQNKRSAEFRAQCRNVDVLLLDDVQFLMGKERTQDEVFHTFNALFEAGKKIVLCSDRPPKELSTLEDRLRSRFEWGVIADIQPPDLETRIAILRHKARQEGFAISNDVASYIAEHVKSNIRELEGALKRIKVYASLHDTPINLDAAREVLSHLVVGQHENRVSIEDVQRAICEYFDITPQQLLGSNRSKKFSHPRHLALYLCRELTDNSFPDIAQKFGGKDHTSVIYACRKIKTTLETDTNTANIVAYLRRQLERGHTA